MGMPSFLSKTSVGHTFTQISHDVLALGVDDLNHSAASANSEEAWGRADVYTSKIAEGTSSCSTLRSERRRELIGRNGAVRRSPCGFRMLDRRADIAGSRMHSWRARAACAKRALVMEPFQPVYRPTGCSLVPRPPIALRPPSLSKQRVCAPRSFH